MESEDFEFELDFVMVWADDKPEIFVNNQLIEGPLWQDSC